MIVFDRMTYVPAPVGVFTAHHGGRRRRAPIPGKVEIASRLDPSWASVVEPVARAIAGGYRGERHTMGLALAGALLWSGVAREQVPALVAAVCQAGGWDIEHHRGSAIDTVMRWSDGSAVSGRSRLPEHVAEALKFALDRRRASQSARPTSPPTQPDELAETTRKLKEVIRSAPIGLTVIKAQCGLGKTHMARAIAEERAARTGVRNRNPKTAIAVPTTELAIQVYHDLVAANVKALRVFGPLSVNGAEQCIYRAPAAALAEGGQSVQKLYCNDCERKNDCKATVGQEGDPGARVLVGPHELLAELDEQANEEGLVFIDEPPRLLRDEPFPLDELIAAERELAAGRFDKTYTEVMTPVLAQVRSWTELAPPEQAGPIARAFVDAETVRASVDLLAEVPPLARFAAAAARGSLGLAMRLGKASRVLRAVWRAVVRPGMAATVYDRGGRSIAITGLDIDIENAILGARRDGTSKDRRVVIAGADAHLHVDRYRQLLGAEVQLHDFAAPDGAPIARTMIVCNDSRAHLATEDPHPIETAARLVAEWALEPPPAASCGVVTFKRHEAVVRRALRASAPGVRWEVAHYGAVRGLDRWKDFDAVATLGDPRPNLDFVSRELGGGGAEVESRYDRADAHARSELEQAHGRLRVIHRTRPGKALHVGALLPGGWPVPTYRRPPEGRFRRPPVPGLAELIEAAGGPRAVARLVGRSAGSVGGWLTGEGRPDASAVEILRRAIAERRLGQGAPSDRKRPLRILKVITDQSQESDAPSDEEAAE